MHGGDIYRNKVKIDFSVNVNPIPLPGSVNRNMRKAIRRCIEYPDMQAVELKQAIARMCGVPEEYILCGNGASELFLAIVHGLKPKKVGILVPSFSGYEYAAKAAGCEIIYFPMAQEEGFCFNPKNLPLENSGIDMLILANPNNPTGHFIEKEQMENFIKECCQKNITVLLDECFIEFAQREIIPSFYPNLIIVRAFTKIYAMPGVRLGYLLCNHKRLLKQIENQLPEWNLSIFAQKAGISASKQSAYRKKTFELIEKERPYLTEALRREGIYVFPSKANFLLLHTTLPLFKALLKRKILIRDCSDFQGLSKDYYRIAIRGHRDNQKLVKAVKDIARSYKEKNSHRYFQNKDCRYFPCHQGMAEFNCLFCYCPLYTMENCPGSPRYMEKNEIRIKICTDCTFPHKPENYDEVIQKLK